MVNSNTAVQSDRRRYWPLDYHECEDMESLVFILNEIVQSGFLIEKILPQPDGRFVILFRRHDLG